MNVLYYPETVCLKEDVLNFMLLNFDKIYFLPIDNQLNPGYGKTISSRFSMADSLLAGAFGSIEDAHYQLMYFADKKSWDDKLKKLMDDYDVLEEKGLCILLEDESYTNSYPLESSIKSDVQDEKFLYYCKKYQNPKLFVPQQPKDTAIKGGGMVFRPPLYRDPFFFPSVCSERVNETLLFCGTHNLIPFTSNELFTHLLSTKYNRALLHPNIEEEKKLRWKKINLK